MSNSIWAPKKKEVKIEPFSSPEMVAQRVAEWVPGLKPDVAEAIGRYHAEMMQFQKALNLISEPTMKLAEAIHFTDSILAARMILPKLNSQHPLYDLGSGNGLPGIVFGILERRQKVILIDRDERKLEFCKHVTQRLNLKNVTIIRSAAEGLPEKSVVQAVSRGFAPLGKAILSCRKIFSQGGKYFHLKGEGWANELGAIPSQLFSFWTPSLLGQYKIPMVNSEMSVVLTDKIAD